jgi:hypothetical protein
MAHTATWAKGKQGDWLARIQSDGVAIGDALVIVSRDGRETQGSVSRIVWSGRSDDGRAVTLAAFSQPERAAQPRRAVRGVRPNWQPCGYPGCHPGYCDECDGEGYRNGR